MSEALEAKRDGARLQKNSGRGDHQKGDAIMDEFLVDYKEASKSFTLNNNVWSKVCTDSLKVGLQYHPILKVILGTTTKVRLGILEWSKLQELREKAAAYERAVSDGLID